MARMGIESIKKEFDYRVIEITRTGTYKAVANITVPDNKVVIVAIDNSDPAEAQIKEYTGTAKEISELEHSLHNKYREQKYKPLITFGGITECFNISILPNII